MRPGAGASRSRESNYRPVRRFTMLIERREVNVNPHSVYLDARVIVFARVFYARRVASLRKGDVTRAREPAKSSLKVLGKRNRLTARIPNRYVTSHRRLSVSRVYRRLSVKRRKKKERHTRTRELCTPGIIEAVYIPPRHRRARMNL